jgi:hypothetical protein
MTLADSAMAGLEWSISITRPIEIINYLISFMLRPEFSGRNNAGLTS